MKCTNLLTHKAESGDGSKGGVLGFMFLSFPIGLEANVGMVMIVFPGNGGGERILHIRLLLIAAVLVESRLSVATCTRSSNLLCTNLFIRVQLCWVDEIATGPSAGALRADRTNALYAGRSKRWTWSAAFHNALCFSDARRFFVCAYCVQ
nr:hypothetical protein CFP56_20213 [Quercus suber]